MAAELVVLRNFSKPGQARMEVVDPDNARLEVYKKKGGYEGAKRAITTMSPEEVIEEVKKSNLRGRGGAGFPTGVKWGFVPKDGQQHYLVINGDEGEPGTFKDRYIMEFDPHAIIEGAMIASYAIGASRAYIYIRGEFYKQKAAMQRAVDEAYAAGLLGKPLWGTEFKLDFTVATGAGAYVCGEESALLESIEGKRGQPRLKPPFPAIVGLFGKPTVINNVETIASLPPIITRGGAWFAGLGTEKSGGTRLFTISGHVKYPGVYELPMTVKLNEIIYEYAGGPGRTDPKTGKPIPLKAVHPGGSSSPLLLPDEWDVTACYDAMAAAGTMAGSGAIIAMDEATCMVKSALILAHFYQHESCGQCTPCREGTRFLYYTLRKFEQGTARMEDIDLMYEVAGNMMGTSICALSEAAAMPIRSYIEKFRSEFEAHVQQKGCPFAEREKELFRAMGWPADPYDMLSEG